MSVIIEGGCSLCGQPVTTVDGVWPPGHGFGKCAPDPEQDPDVVEGPTIELCRGCFDRIPVGPCAADCWLRTEQGAEALKRAKRNA